MKLIGDFIVMNAGQGSVEERKILLLNGMTTIVSGIDMYPEGGNLIV